MQVAYKPAANEIPKYQLLVSWLRQRQALNAVAAIVQVVADAAVVVGVLAIVMRHCDTKEIGLWAFVLAWMSFSRIADVSIAPTVVRFCAMAIKDSDFDQARAVVLGGLVRVLLRVGLLSTVILACLLYYLGATSPFGGLTSTHALALYAFAYVILLALSGLVFSAIDGLSKTYLRSAFAVISGAARIAITAFSVQSMGIAGFALGLIAQSLISIILGGGWLAYYLSGSKAKLTVNQDRNVFWSTEMVAFGRSFQAAGVYQMLLEPSTRIVFPIFADLSALGYYDIASKFVAQVRAAVMAPAVLMLPRFAAKQGAPSGDVAKLYSTCSLAAFAIASTTFTMLVAILPVLSIFWLGRLEPMFVLYGTVIAIAWAVNAFSSVAYYYLLANGRLKVINRGALTMAILNVVGGVVGGALAGGIGCAIAFSLAIALGSCTFIREANVTVGRLLTTSLTVWCGFAGLSALTLSMLVSWYFTWQHLSPSVMQLVSASGICLLYTVLIHVVALLKIRRQMSPSLHPKVSE